MDLSVQKSGIVGGSYPLLPRRESTSAAGLGATTPATDVFQPSGTVAPPPSPLAETVAPAPVAPTSPPLPAAPPVPAAPAEVGGWLVVGGHQSSPEPSAPPIANGPSLEDSLAQTMARLTAANSPVYEAPAPPPAVRLAPKPTPHPGIELHNHMLGIVDTSYFIHKAGGGSPRLLLDRIDAIFRDNPALQQESPQLWRLLQRSEGDVTRQPASVVGKTLTRLLTATQYTPFDSVYTPRDELIKRHLEIPPDRMAEVLDQTSFKDQLLRRFAGQHQGGALEAVAQATPEELQERGRLTPEQSSQLQSLMVKKRFEIFTEDSVRALSKDNIRYSEQSISLNKLQKTLSPEIVRRVAQRLEQEGIHSDLRFLAMLNTSHMSESFLQNVNPRTGIPVVFEQKGLEVTPQQYYKLMGTFQQEGMSQADAIRRIANAEPEELQKVGGLSAEQARIVTAGLPPQVKSGLQQVLLRGDVMGIDIAAPETESFTPRGMKNLDEMYDLLKEAAQQRGRPLVLRPHVGEGYPEMPQGLEDFARYEAVRHSETGTPTHYDRAEQNLETLIAHLESRGYNAEKAKEDGVIIRFGHATHATPQQIVRMKALGVHAEANLSSNVETGALQPVHRGDFFENHSLLNLLYQGVPTTINTDAHGVMHTTLEREYQQADRLLAQFKRNKLPLEIEGRQVYYRDLSDEVKARFDPARLRQWAEDYGAMVAQGDQQDRSRATANG